jgi:hypothetical protein
MDCGGYTGRARAIYLWIVAEPCTEALSLRSHIESWMARLL